MTDEPLAAPEQPGSREPGRTPVEALLKEYELTASTAGRLHGLVWGSTAALAALTFGGAAYLLVNLPADVFGLLVVAGAAGFAMLVLICSWLLQERWSALARLYGYRRQEIEAELGLRAGRYAEALEARAEGRPHLFPPDASEAAPFQALEERLARRAALPHVSSRVRTAILILCASAWVFAAALQLLSVFVYR